MNGEFDGDYMHNSMSDGIEELYLRQRCRDKMHVNGWHSRNVHKHLKQLRMLLCSLTSTEIHLTLNKLPRE